MEINFYHFLALDVPPLLTALFAVSACALAGNFLMLRRMSMMGDAISHAVLPGIVTAFLITGSRSDLPVFIGAALAGLAAVVLIELTAKLGRIEFGASMGVVFSIFFALGVVLMEQAAARNVDLDADCLLYGQLETVFWFPSSKAAEFFSWRTLSLLPSELVAAFTVLCLVSLLVALLFKELKLYCFDPALAGALGFGQGRLNLILMLLTAAAVVVSFKAVGSILVIAMMVVPPACARLCTDRLKSQIWLSQLLAALMVLCGYFAGAFLPMLAGLRSSLNVAGMISVVAGVFLALFSLFAPRYGIISAWLRNSGFALEIHKDDLLALLYRLAEDPDESRQAELSKIFSFRTKGLTGRAALWLLKISGQIGFTDGSWKLLAGGQIRARSLVRSHRLWEAYLVDKAEVSSDHVHACAEALEHFTTPELAGELARELSTSRTDPHGKLIPE